MSQILEVALANTDQRWFAVKPESGGKLLCLPNDNSSDKIFFKYWMLSSNQVALGIKNPKVHQSYFLVGNDGPEMEILTNINNPNPEQIVFNYPNCVFNYVQDTETFYFRLQHNATGKFVQKSLNEKGVLQLVDDPMSANFWYLNVKPN